VSLALWVAEYYACGAGEAIGAAMPPRAWIESERHARSPTPARADAARTRRQARDPRAAGEREAVRVETLIGEGADSRRVLGSSATAC
jgi:hypothetical protein